MGARTVEVFGRVYHSHYIMQSSPFCFLFHFLCRQSSNLNTPPVLLPKYQHTFAFLEVKCSFNHGATPSLGLHHGTVAGRRDD